MASSLSAPDPDRLLSTSSTHNATVVDSKQESIPGMSNALYAPAKVCKSFTSLHMEARPKQWTIICDKYTHLWNRLVKVYTDARQEPDVINSELAMNLFTRYRQAVEDRNIALANATDAEDKLGQQMLAFQKSQKERDALQRQLTARPGHDAARTAADAQETVLLDSSAHPENGMPSPEGNDDAARSAFDELLQRVTKERDDAQTDADQQRVLVDRLKSDNQKLDEQFMAAERARITLGDAVVNTEQDRDYWSRKYHECKALLDTTKDNAAAAVGHDDYPCNQCAQLEEQLEEVTNARDRYLQELSDSKKEVSSLKERVGNANRNAADFRNTCNELEEEIAKLKAAAQRLHGNTRTTRSPTLQDSRAQSTDDNPPMALLPAQPSADQVLPADGYSLGRTHIPSHSGGQYGRSGTQPLSHGLGSHNQTVDNDQFNQSYNQMPTTGNMNDTFAYRLNDDIRQWQTSHPQVHFALDKPKSSTMPIYAHPTDAIRRTETPCSQIGDDLNVTNQLLRQIAETPHSSTRAVLKGVRVPPFDGKHDGRDFSKWAKDFDEYCFMQNPHMPARVKLWWLKQALTGLAQLSFDAFPDSISSDYQLSMDKLKQKFGDQQCATVNRARLFSRKQAPDESVREFCAALEKLAQQAFLGYDPEITEDMLGTAFSQNVLEKWQEKATENTMDTYEQKRQKVIDAERHWKNLREIRASKRNDLSAKQPARQDRNPNRKPTVGMSDSNASISERRESMGSRATIEPTIASKRPPPPRPPTDASTEERDRWYENKYGSYLCPDCPTNAGRPLRHFSADQCPKRLRGGAKAASTVNSGTPSTSSDTRLSVGKFCSALPSQSDKPARAQFKPLLNLTMGAVGTKQTNVTGLLDTGCDYSIVDKEVCLNYFRANPQIQPPTMLSDTELKIRGVSGPNFLLTLKIRIPIELNGRQIECEMFIMENCNQSLLFGIDLIIAFGGMANVCVGSEFSDFLGTPANDDVKSKKTLDLVNKLYALHGGFANKTPPKKTLFRSKPAVHIQEAMNVSLIAPKAIRPGCGALLRVDLGAYRSPTTGVNHFWPNKLLLMQHGLDCPEAIITPKDGTAVLPVRNLSPLKVELQEGYQIGFIEAAELCKVHTHASAPIGTASTASTFEPEEKKLGDPLEYDKDYPLHSQARFEKLMSDIDLSQSALSEDEKAKFRDFLRAWKDSNAVESSHTSMDTGEQSPNVITDLLDLIPGSPAGIYRASNVRITRILRQGKLTARLPWTPASCVITSHKGSFLREDCVCTAREVADDPHNVCRPVLLGDVSAKVSNTVSSGVLRSMFIARHVLPLATLPATANKVAADKLVLRMLQATGPTCNEVVASLFEREVEFVTNGKPVTPLAPFNELVSSTVRQFAKNCNQFAAALRATGQLPMIDASPRLVDGQLVTPPLTKGADSPVYDGYAAALVRARHEEFYRATLPQFCEGVVHIVGDDTARAVIDELSDDSRKLVTFSHADDLAEMQRKLNIACFGQKLHFLVLACAPPMDISDEEAPKWAEQYALIRHCLHPDNYVAKTIVLAPLPRMERETTASQMTEVITNLLNDEPVTVLSDYRCLTLNDGQADRMMWKEDMVSLSAFGAQRLGQTIRSVGVPVSMRPFDPSKPSVDRKRRRDPSPASSHRSSYDDFKRPARSDHGSQPVSSRDSSKARSYKPSSHDEHKRSSSSRSGYHHQPSAARELDPTDLRQKIEQGHTQAVDQQRGKGTSRVFYSSGRSSGYDRPSTSKPPSESGRSQSSRRRTASPPASSSDEDSARSTRKPRGRSATKKGEAQKK